MNQEYIQNPNPDVNMPPQYQQPIQPVYAQPPMQPADPQPPKKDNRVFALLCIIIALLVAIITAVVVIWATSKDDDETNEVKGNKSPTTESTQSVTDGGEKPTDEAVSVKPSEAACPFCKSAKITAANPNGFKSCNDCGASWAENGGNAGNNGSGGGLNIGGGLTMDDEGDASADGSADGSTDGSAEGDAAEGEGESGPKKPTSVQDVLDLYNNSINKVISDKAGYSKSRTTTINTLDGGALLKIQLVVDMVHDFLGSGTTVYKNEKGKAEYLSKASITKDDINAIDIQEADGLWVITLGLKPGQSQASAAGSSDTTPIQRSGLFVGTGDKKAFDYKSSENIYTAINGVAKAESAQEAVTRTNITAKIDPETGKLVELTVDWDWNVQLTNVSYSVATVKSAKGTATSKVVVKNFQY